MIYTVENQAFSGSYDLAPHPPPPPSPVSKLDRRHTERMRKGDNMLTEERGGGGGEKLNHMTARKPGPL